MKDWFNPKLVYNIQVFLSFTNFYWQFIQGFSKIAASLTSILKITWLPDKSRLEVGNNNGEVIRFGISDNSSMKLAKKSRKSKSQKLSKSQKMPKSKKLSKSGNLP